VPGARLAAPHFQGSLFVNYGFDLTPKAKANASVTVQHVGSYPGSFPNVPGQPTTISPTYGFTDAYENVNATFAVAMDRLTVGAYVENLFDDHSITYVHPEAFLASRFATMRPRTVGVRLGYDF
jgi:iron complex outermembrane receptor protein